MTLQLSQDLTRLQSNLDYPDLFFPWSLFFFMTISKIDLEILIEMIKSSLIIPNMHRKHCFNLFRFEKVQAAR